MNQSANEFETRQFLSSLTETSSEDQTDFTRLKLYEDVLIPTMVEPRAVPSEELDRTFLDQTNFNATDMQKTLSENFGNLDIDGSGALSEDELLTGVVKLSTNEQASHAYAAYRAFNFIEAFNGGADISRDDIALLGAESAPDLGFWGNLGAALDAGDKGMWVSGALFSLGVFVANPWISVPSFIVGGGLQAISLWDGYDQIGRQQRFMTEIFNR